MGKHSLAGAVALLALAGCHGGSKGGVFARHGGSPDEFAVGRAAPLTVPPDFTLVPPRPGAPRPQEADSSQQALGALFGGQQPASAGENALLRAAGPAPVAGARTDADVPGTSVVVNKGSATRDILSSPAVSNAQADARTTAGESATPSGGANTPDAANTNPGGTAPQGNVPNGPVPQ